MYEVDAGSDVITLPNILEEPLISYCLISYGVTNTLTLVELDPCFYIGLKYY